MVGSLTPEVGQNGSEQRFRCLCGRIRISLARSAAFWTFWMFSTSRWENIADAPDLLQTRATLLHQRGKVSSQGEYSESSTHVQAVLPTVGLADIACGCDCAQLLFALDDGEELFPKLRTPTGLMVQVKNKTQNWAIH